MASEEEEVVNLAEIEEETDVEPQLERVLEEVPPARRIPAFSRPVNPIVVSKRWKEYIDAATNRPYYFDRVTKGVQWRKPAGFLTRKELLRPVSANQIGTSDWKVVSTLGGRDYFYQFTTGKAAWELPEDFNTPIPVKVVEEPESFSSTSNRKRPSEDDLYDEAPEQKRRMLGPNSKNSVSLVDKFADTRDLNVTNYTNMLKSFGVDKDATWAEWQAKLAKDGRFNAVVSLVERRSLFESFVRQLATEHKQSRKRELEAAKAALWLEIDKLPENSLNNGFDAFKDQLRPTEAYQHLREVHSDSIGDIYDEMVEREAEKKRKVSQRAKRDFLAMLEERIRDRFEKNMRKDWLDFKLELEMDPRYNRAQLSGGDREQLFEDFTAEIRRAAAPRSSERHTFSRDRYEEVRKEDRDRHSEPNRREEALRQRFDEASRQRSREEHYAREKHERAREDREATQFRTLLAERVLKSSVSWEDVESSLSRDPRFETQYLSSRDKRRLFDNHLIDLKRTAEKTFFKILNSTGSGDFYLNWPDASTELIGTPAFTLIATNAEREATYDRWARESKNRAEIDLQALFKATPAITADTDLENKKEMLDLLDELRKDVRWRVLPDSSEGWSSRRMALLGDYIATQAPK